MPKIYCQNSKIKDAVGRSEYISGLTEKQEEVIIHKYECTLGWDYYNKYEHEQSLRNRETTNRNAAREYIIKLDNSLASKIKGQTTEEQKKVLTTLCDEVVEKLIGENHDYEYAVHWNKERTNLHVHILFSEREKVNEPQVKKYKKDIWVDEATNRLAKANAEGAVLKHRKGEVVFDADGNPKYDDSVLGKKDLKFKSKSYLKEEQKILQAIFGKYGLEYEVHDNRSPYLVQKKYNPHFSDEVKNNIINYNNVVKDYNAQVRSHLQIDAYQKENYIVIKNDIQCAISEANKEDETLSKRAIHALNEVTSRIKLIVEDAMRQIKVDVLEWWNKEKDYYLDLFKLKGTDTNGNSRRIKELSQFVEPRKRESENTIKSSTSISGSERFRTFTNGRHSGRDEIRNRESIKQSSSIKFKNN